VEIDVQDDLVLIPGGQAVGVALYTQGLLVVGTSDLKDAQSPARLAGIKAGDLITELNGVPLTSTEQLKRTVAEMGERPIPLTVKRGDSIMRLTLEAKKDSQLDAFRIGAWVRDGTAGVGTLSFYGNINGNESAYGALGHAITDSDTQQILTVGQGRVMLADVVDVRKGTRGVPGELKGSFFREKRMLGDIEMNNQFGIYGVLENQPTHPIYPNGLPIGRKDAVHTGPATILSTVGAEGMQEYDVEIVEVSRQNSPAQRSMVVRVVDPRLLEITGGIVQGMSGSPIIQDGRLIGAVTHVYVNDPTMGYGLFIEWMLEQAGSDTMKAAS
jgi:stage IV sporulation protein B